MFLLIYADATNSIGYEINNAHNSNSSNEIHSQPQYILHPPQVNSRLGSVPSTSVPLPTAPAASAAAAVLAASSPTTSSLANNQQGRLIEIGTFHSCFLKILFPYLSTCSLCFLHLSFILEQYTARNNAC